MNRPIFLSSFFSAQRSGSKLRISPAMRQSNPLASNWVMGPMALRPACRLLQTSWVPIPEVQTRPTPVTTTRRLKVVFLLCGTRRPGGLLFCLRVFLDVRDGVFDRGDCLCILVGNFDAERLFEGHHQLDRIERVGAQIIHKRSGGRHLALIHPQLLDDDLLDAFFDAGHSVYPSALWDFRFRFWLLRLPFRASDSPPILCTAPSKVNRGGRSEER